MIIRETRIVIPQSLRRRVVSLGHEEHQGVVKTKERLRTKVWWPVMDRDAERRCAEYLKEMGMTSFEPLKKIMQIS